MDNQTFLVAFIIQSLFYTTTFYGLSIKRKTQSFLIFTISYLLIAIMNSLTFFQADLPTFFSVILINLLFYLFFLAMIVGFMVYLKHPVRWLQLSLPLIVGFLLLLLFTYTLPNYSMRIVISSLTTVFITLTGYWQIRKPLKNLSSHHHRFMFALIGFYGAISIARIIDALFFHYSMEGYLVENLWFNTIIAITLLLSIHLWTLLILTLDQWTMQRDLKKKNEELSVMASTDPLTGLNNRHFLDQDVEQYSALADRFNTPLSFIMYDLDHFKTINDVYGHDYGDEVLIKVTQAVQKNLRHSDIAYRWGGEEF